LTLKTFHADFLQSLSFYLTAQVLTPPFSICKNPEEQLIK
jgi:hypothetical protein